MNFAVSVILKTTLLLSCASLMTLALRRASASVRHLIWVITLSAVVVLPFASSFVPQVELPVLPETEESADTSGFSLSEIWQPRRTIENPVRPGVRNSLVAPPSPRSPWYWQQWIAAIWLCGVVAVLARLLLGSLAARRLAQSASEVRGEEWLSVLESLKNQLGLRARVSLKVVNQPVPPMTWGLFRHVVLLPASALEWTLERKHLVLAHELAHVKRHDGVIQILVQAVCSLYWFNPVTWYAARQLRIARECACDDYVLKLGVSSDGYADHLLQVARAVNPANNLSIATVAMAHRSQLETRLLCILDNRTRRHGASRGVLAALGTGVALLTLSVAAISLTARPGPPPAITPVSPLALIPDLDFDGFPDVVQGPGMIQGVVMQLGTNAPLRDVLVSLTPVDSESSAGAPARYDVETRPDGTFAMMDLPPGQYRMTLAHDDFVRLHSRREPQQVTVGDGRPLGDIRLHMVPGPAISGRILDDAGNAVDAAHVELLRMETREGKRALQSANTSVVTDEHGEYRFFGLEPGEYYLRTRPSGALELAAVYYPGVTDSSHATPISVRSGADITGINLPLARGKQHSVKVKVAIAAPQPQHPELSFYVNPRGGRSATPTPGPGMKFAPGPDNTWTSPPLAPGSYEIEVYLRDPDPVRWGRTAVEIKDSDVDAGTVVVGPGVWMLGNILSMDNLPAAVRKNQLFVTLKPLDGSVFLLPSAKVSEDGTFVIPRVPERKFRVELSGLPPEVLLSTVRYGGQESREILVNGDPTKLLELVLAPSGGAVAGVVRNSKDQPMSGSQIVMIPLKKDSAEAFKTVTADQFGVFSIGGLPPGEYGILAWQKSTGTFKPDPAYLKSLEQEAVKVIVLAGYTNTVNIRALPPPQ